MHRAVVKIRDIREAKVKGKGSFYIAQYPVHGTAQSALHFLPPCVHTICDTFATSKEDLTNIIPYHAITGCDAVSDIADHGKSSACKSFYSNPDLLASIGKRDFHDETYSSYPRSSSAGCSIFLMRAAMIMHGWLCLQVQIT